MIVLNKIKNYFNRIQKSNNITSYVSGKIIFLNTWIKKNAPTFICSGGKDILSYSPLGIFTLFNDLCDVDKC